MSDAAGKESYQRLLEEESFLDSATDFYTLGLFALIGKNKSGVCNKNLRTKVFAVYRNTTENLHEHLISAADFSCDLNRTSEKHKLLSLLKSESFKKSTKAR